MNAPTPRPDFLTVAREVLSQDQELSSSRGLAERPSGEAPAPSPLPANVLADLTADQRARLDSDAEFRSVFERMVEPFLPKPTGVCWSGMPGEPFVPVQAVYGNAERQVRMDRAAGRVAA